ncbi:MAG TPA: hypothetical protein VH083_25485 [Myxococcales bacterium]|nr:hypothetical protein [Myxococcales bacterium]
MSFSGPSELASLRIAAVFRAAAWIVALLVSGTWLLHLVTGSPAMFLSLEDDHYYYTVVADRLVSSGKLSFDGVTLTNGFHPLWFLVIAALRAVFGRFGSMYWIAFASVLFVCTVLTFELAARFLRALGAESWLAAGIAAAFSFGNALLAATGMETAICAPLFLWLLAEVARGGSANPRQAAKLGLIASLTVLARIDLGLAVALLVLGLIVLERPGFKAICAFGCAGLLLPIYAAANLKMFGGLLPISAVAKEQLLRTAFHPRYLWTCSFYTCYEWFAGPLLALGALALFLELRSRRLDLRLLAAGVPIVFAAVFFFLNSFTGWVYFGWYAFPYAAALPASFWLMWQRWLMNDSHGRRSPRRMRAFGLALLTCLGIAALSGATRHFVERGPLGTASDYSMLAMSLSLSERMRDHAGTYAMGAMAGAVSQRLEHPVFQLEGLVGDRRMLAHLRNQDPLPQVLAENHVDYLIVSYADEPAPRRKGCYVIQEPYPVWARESKRLSGVLCATPIVDFVTEHGPHSWSFFGALETLVFDLHGARWEPN